MLLVTSFAKWSCLHRLIVPARHSYAKVRTAYFVTELPSLAIIFENLAILGEGIAHTERILATNSCLCHKNHYSE